jgi:predicted lipoprotein with Yx(FWY)xxD motif
MRTLPSFRSSTLGTAAALAAAAALVAGCGSGGGTSSSGSTSASATNSTASGGGGYGYNRSTASSPRTSSRPAGAGLVTVGHTGLGSVLTDGKGLTLYLFEKDQGAASRCSGACAQAWPPLTTTGSPAVRGAAKASLLSTFKRADGTRQVAYDGHPLYRFAADTKPGQTSGEGSTAFGAGWDVLRASGQKVEEN